MQSTILLPQVKFSYSQFKFSSEMILITGGRKPNVAWFNALKNLRRDCKIFSVDHGIDFCRENDILPEILIGDLDSAESSSIEWVMDNKIKIERHPVDKDFTDTQLALQNFQEISEDKFFIITGAFGGRLDHLYSTLFTCANSKIKNCLTDEQETVIFLNGGESVKLEFMEKPFALSFLPMSETCDGVSIDGVHWKLNSASLSQKLPNAVSNRVESNIVKISVTSGKLAVYLYFQHQS